MRSSTFIKEALHQLPDLKMLENYLQQDLDILIENTFSPVSSLPMPPDTCSGLETMLPQDNNRRSKSTNKHEQAKQLLEQGKPALAKIRKEGIDADLTPEELEGFEAIVLLIGRPSILIQNGS